MAEGLADFAVVDGLVDVVLRACIVGQGDVEVDDEGLRLFFASRGLGPLLLVLWSCAGATENPEKG